jgi:class 3 adenylate cyclase
MSLISDEITKLGGYIISRIEGDMIRAIFPDGPSGGGAERCLAALVGSQHALDGFQASMLTIQDKSVQKYFAEALAFRAGVAYGKVVPAFDSSGPTWLHADETTPLLDSVRLAEGEPTFGIRETLILMQESIARDVPGDIEWLSKGERELSAKHGRTSRPWVATIAKKTYSIPNAA